MIVLNLISGCYMGNQKAVDDMSHGSCTWASGESVNETPLERLASRRESVMNEPAYSSYMSAYDYEQRFGENLGFGCFFKS